MSTEGSIKVILFSLGANLGIAAAKFIGAFVSGSASLLAEATHSTADCGNQILLLVGNRAARKPADQRHPLGYGRENFFWSFMVALILFSMGGLFSIYEGLHKFSHPEPIGYLWVGFGILGVGIFLEALSFRACLNEVRHQNVSGSLRQWFAQTPRSDLLVIFTEDAAALVGLLIAALCLGMAWLGGDPRWDALGSILIGVVLVTVALFLARETKSLLIGESPAQVFEGPIDEIVQRVIPGSRVIRLIALQLSASDVLVSYKILPGDIREVSLLLKAINEVERHVRDRFPQIKWQFVEPDIEP